MCDKGHEWHRSVYENANSNGCPYCTGRRVDRSNSLATLNPALAQEWNRMRNGNLNPHDVKPNSSRKVWWKCEKGHEWEMNINVRQAGIGNCPFCMGKRVCPENSLANLYPYVANQWHPAKNDDLTANDVTYKSSKKAWWQCELGHTWEAVIRSRTVKGAGCPVCSKLMAAPDYNLKTEYPNVAKE